jgi:hypothetical protein
MDPTESTASGVEVSWLGVRILLPFAFARAASDGSEAGAVPPELRARLRALRFRGLPAWMPARPDAQYLDEALGPVQRAVFPDGPDDRERYWRVPTQVVPAAEGQPGVPEVLGVMLPASTRVELASGHAIRIRPLRPFGIELFLSNFGFGALSIALEADLEGEARAAVATELAYRLSQILERKLIPLRWPHPFDDEKKKQEIVRQGRAEGIEPPPGPGAGVEERLGVPGGSVSLPELARFLLPFDVAPFQAGLDRGNGPELPKLVSGQFNAYVVVRIAGSPGFTLIDHPMRDAIGTLLTSLGQLQEPRHAGNQVSGCHVTERLLNRYHWAASTSLAAAHVVLDQPGDPDWNFQGPRHYLSKYFVPALLAHHQRRHAELVVASSWDAAELLRGRRDGAEERVARIERDMLQFELSAAFPTVSTRHVVNVWYEACREGERADVGLAQARESIARLNGALAGSRQEKLAKANEDIAAASSGHLDVIAKVQRNVEWIEIFIIGVYAMEAVHHVAEVWHFASWFKKASIVALPLAAAYLALRLLRPDQLHPGTSHEPRQMRLLLVLGVSFVAWFLLGAAIATH